MISEGGKKMNKKSKLKKLLKRRETIILRIEKDEKKFEEVQRLMEVARQKNQEKLNALTQEIIGCIDDSEVQAFVNRFADELVADHPEGNKGVNIEDKYTEGSEVENVEEKRIDGNEGENVEEKYIEGHEGDNTNENIPVDDYAESFRRQYGL